MNQYYHRQPVQSSNSQRPRLLTSIQVYTHRHETLQTAAVVREEAFDTIVDMTWCHQSQIAEWLPWVDRHQLTKPESKADWAGQVRGIIRRRNREMGIEGEHATEYFKITAWGNVPGVETLIEDFPALIDPEQTRVQLVEHLAKWQ